MIACLSIPGFDLKAALRTRPALALRPAALAPEAGAEPLIGPVTAAAEAGGGPPAHRPGHRCGGGGGSPPADAARRGARDLPAARPRRARSGGGRARVGG